MQLHLLASTFPPVRLSPFNILRTMTRIFMNFGIESLLNVSTYPNFGLKGGKITDALHTEVHVFLEASLK
jgi:hypothetical protein